MLRANDMFLNNDHIFEALTPSPDPTPSTFASIHFTDHSASGFLWILYQRSLSFTFILCRCRFECVWKRRGQAKKLCSTSFEVSLYMYAMRTGPVRMLSLTLPTTPAPIIGHFPPAGPRPLLRVVSILSLRLLTNPFSYCSWNSIRNQSAPLQN